MIKNFWSFGDDLLGKNTVKELGSEFESRGPT